MTRTYNLTVRYKSICTTIVSNAQVSFMFEHKLLFCKSSLGFLARDASVRLSVWDGRALWSYSAR